MPKTQFIKRVFTDEENFIDEDCTKDVNNYEQRIKDLKDMIGKNSDEKNKLTTKDIYNQFKEGLE